MKYSAFSKASASEYRTLNELDRRASRQRAKRNNSAGTSAALAGMTSSALLYDDKTRNQAGHILRGARNDANTLRGPLSRKLLPKASDRARAFGRSTMRQIAVNPRGAIALGGASLAAGAGGKAIYHSGREASINHAADNRRKQRFEATTVNKSQRSVFSREDRIQKSNRRITHWENRHNAALEAEQKAKARRKANFIAAGVLGGATGVALAAPPVGRRMAARGVKNLNRAWTGDGLHMGKFKRADRTVRAGNKLANSKAGHDYGLMGAGVAGGGLLAARTDRLAAERHQREANRASDKLKEIRG